MRHKRSLTESAARVLAVIQAKATQFDGPFFRYLAKQNAFRLKVYYTSNADASRPFDPELNLCPDWNHDAVSGYSFQVYPAGFFRRVKTSIQLVASRPDLIVVSGWRSLDNLLVVFLARLWSVPLGLRADNCEITQVGGAAKTRIRRFLRNQLLGLFSTGHPVGSRAGAYMTAGGIKASRLFLFPYLVDQEFLTAR